MRSSLPLGKSSLLSSLVLAATLTLSGCSSPVSEAELVARASEAIANGDLAAAELDVKTALQQNPENAAARSLYGQIYLRQINPSSAVIEFERSLESSPSNATRMLLAKALVQAGESAELLSEFDLGAYASISSEPEFHAVLARAYLAQTQYEKARAALASASEAGNEYVDITRAVFALQLDNDSDGAKSLLHDVVERSPANAHAWSLLGIIAINDEDRDAAEEYFAQASIANPYRLGDRLQLVTTQIRLGKGEAADKDLAQLEQLIPNYPEVNFLRGQLYFDAGDYENAIDAFSQVLSVNPSHTGALLLSANANVRQQNLATAQRQFSQFLSQQPGHLQASLQLADVWWQLGEPDQTEAIARDILKEHKMDVRALGLLAMALAAQNMPAESAQAYQQIAELQPESAETLVALGSQLLVSGEAEAGIDQLQAAIALDPSSAPARERLIEAQLSVNDVTAAEEAARDYRVQAPESPRSAVYLGRVLLQSEDLSGARLAFEEALEIDPGNIGASGGMAALAILDDDVEGAIDAFRVALNANPGEVVTSMNLAVLQEQVGDMAGMQETLSVAVDVNPKAVEPRLALARYELGQRQPAEAINLINPVKESHESDYRVHQLLARAYMVSGQPEAAANSARTLLALQGDDPNVLAVVAQVEIVNGRPDVAESHLLKALETRPESSDLRKMLVSVLIQQSRAERASEEIAKLPKDVRNEAAVVVVRGRLALAAGDPAEAKALFQQAFEQDRSSVNLVFLATAQWMAGDRVEVFDALESWLGDYPDDVLVLNELASRKLESGSEDEAEQHYRTLLALQPENALVLNNLAWLLRTTDVEEALDFIARADRIVPNSPQIKDTYAMVELERGKFERALNLNQKAIDSAQGDRNIRFNRAQILSRAGQKDEAVDLLRELVAGPAFASQADAKALLDTL
ncbi:PEP-CTERM system TPR-repeat protein PrsT [bacterium]|nr:PEP-CTERM system TPR-repeat protein PrsT [bacterium]